MFMNRSANQDTGRAILFFSPAPGEPRPNTLLCSALPAIAPWDPYVYLPAVTLLPKLPESNTVMRCDLDTPHGVEGDNDVALVVAVGKTDRMNDHHSETNYIFVAYL